MCAQVTSARAPILPSAAEASDLRQSKGSGAATKPARRIANTAMTLSTVFGSCKATAAFAGKPSDWNWQAKAEMARSACA